MKHFPYSELDLFSDHEMPFWKYVWCKVHLLHCSACRERLDLLHSDKDLIERLQKIHGRSGHGTSGKNDVKWQSHESGK